MAGSTRGLEPARWPAAVAAALSRPQLLLTLIGAMAVGGLVCSLAVVERAPAGGLQIAAASGAFAVAQLARIHQRARGEVITLAWGEVGVIIALCLVPALWLPAVVAAGTLITHGPRLIRSVAVPRSRAAYSIFMLPLGALAATAAVAITADSRSVLRTTLGDPGPLVSLGLAAMAYFLTNSALAAAWSSSGGGFGPIWLSVARAKRLMLAVTVPMGIAVAFAAGRDATLVIALAPFLWVAHQLYAHRVNFRAERRIWAALADATRALHQLDEPSVAAAAVRGAFDIFSPAEVELSWRGLAGPTRRYGARARDLRSGISGPARADPRPPASVRSRAQRPLVVGGVRMGELELRFRHSLPFTAADEMALSAYADAVASALHDPSTHRRLADLAARTAYEAAYDPLTGLNNLPTLIARGNELLRHRAPGGAVALLLLRVDGSREVNEALSHDAGDRMLQVLARRLEERCADGELLGCPGRDEFALLITRGPDRLEGWSAPIEGARAMLAVLAAPAEVSGVTIAVQACAGVVITQAGGCDMAELLRRANVALHQANRDVSRVARYDAATDAASTDRLTLLADVHDALGATDQLSVLIQLAVDLRTGAPVSAEMLARWQHPRRGRLLPAEFIPALEHSELAAGFTQHIIDLALSIAAAWASQGIDLPVSVNLCARCMVSPDLVPEVATRLTRHAVPASRLILEMRESVMDADASLVRGVIADVRERGIRVSVDDFGTGSASLSLLTRFAVDEVKVDRGFVASMGGSAPTAAIVRTTVDLARELGLRVVAEGVERPDQRDALLDLGVTVAQGYLFHAPLPVAEATAIVQRHLQPANPPAAPIAAAGST